MAEVLRASSFVVPREKITNDELVNSYNAYADWYNTKYIADIKAGEKEALDFSNADFIYKASGIKQRFVHNKSGILDPQRMYPLVPKRAKGSVSLQAEFALNAAEKLLKKTSLEAKEIDAIVVACSNYERAYPGIGVEVADILGLKDFFALDVNAGCASAAFGISTAQGLIRAGTAKRVMVLTPELYSFHMNFKDRRSHFIFGDGCSAVLLEDESIHQDNEGFLIHNTRLVSKFSNNIRNNFGFINVSEDKRGPDEEYRFKQNGRNVKEDVVPFTINHIKDHLAEVGWQGSELKRLWLHQANIHMMNAIAEEVLERPVDESLMPETLHEFANTAGSSVIGCFDKYHEDMVAGEIGVICAFGAGYSVGSVALEKL